MYLDFYDEDTRIMKIEGRGWIVEKEFEKYPAGEMAWRPSESGRSGQ